MKRLYIPTSTFNFNNILSSESVSPKAFYGQRGFGYSRWMTIPENGIENVTLLYEKPFVFSRPKSDVEDHPMLIELQTDIDFHPTNVDGVYYCDYTIYLDPWNTSFIFFDENALRTTLSMSDSSLETKLVNLYRKKIFVRDFSNMHPTPQIKVEVELNTKSISYDITVNKMKGLLYGYYIGALLSTSKEWVRRYSILSEIKDLFSSIASSEDKMPTMAQKTKLEAMIYDIQKESPALAGLDKYWRSDINLNQLIDKLKGNGWTCADLVDQTRIMDSIMGIDNGQYAFDWLEREEQKLCVQAQKTPKLISVKNEEIVVANNQLHKLKNSYLKEEDEALLKILVNEIFVSKNYNGKISTFKAEISDTITQRAKDMLGEKWADSELKQQLNQVRHYVRGQEASFDWDYMLIASLASVLSKGNEWGSLLSFMRRKQISDYRIAYAIYGELHGFANMTRDFTDHLYGLSDKSYIAAVYKEIYGQLFGDSAQLLELEPYSSQKGSLGNTQMASWKEEVLQIWETLNRQKNRKELLGELKETLEQVNTIDSLISSLFKKDFWSKATKLQTALKKRLGVKKKVKRESCDKVESGDLFATTNSVSSLGVSKRSNDEYFSLDPKAWDYMKDYIPQSYQAKIHEDFDWFIGEVRKEKNLRYKYYKEIDKLDNRQVINSFCNLKKKQAYYFSDSLRETLKNALLKRYGGK